MAIPYFTDDVEIISKLGAHPNTDNNLNEQDLKEKFDEAASLIKRYLNEQLVPALANVGGYSRTVLWKNPSPYSKFSSQTVSLPIGDYDAVEIVYMNEILITSVITFGTTGEIPVLAGNSMQATLNVTGSYPAEALITQSKINFTMSDKETNIPYIVYGIKY